jgi:hypothetical protein
VTDGTTSLFLTVNGLARSRGRTPLPTPPGRVRPGVVRATMVTRLESWPRRAGSRDRWFGWIAATPAAIDGIVEVLRRGRS